MTYLDVCTTYSLDPLCADNTGKITLWCDLGYLERKKLKAGEIQKCVEAKMPEASHYKCFKKANKVESRTSRAEGRIFVRCGRPLRLVMGVRFGRPTDSAGSALRPSLAPCQRLALALSSLHEVEVCFAAGPPKPRVARGPAAVLAVACCCCCCCSAKAWPRWQEGK